MNPVQHMKKTSLPMILAHRGLVTKYQENTMAAIQAAIDSPACDGCEIDVLLTKDKQAVLFHDENMKRLTGIDKYIADMTWPELQDIRIKKDIEADGGMRHYEVEERVPLLSDVLAAIKGQDFFVNIELKAKGAKWSTRKTGTEVAKVVRTAAIENQVVCSSFNPFMLYCLEKEHGSIHSGFAYYNRQPASDKVINWVMEGHLIGRWTHADFVVAEYTLIDDTIAEFHQKGMSVGSFTLFPLTPAGRENAYDLQHSVEVLRLAQLNVDWIETDTPDKVHALLHQSISGDNCC